MLQTAFHETCVLYSVALLEEARTVSLKDGEAVTEALPPMADIQSVKLPVPAKEVSKLAGSVDGVGAWEYLNDGTCMETLKGEEGTS